MNLKASTFFLRNNQQNKPTNQAAITTTKPTKRLLKLGDLEAVGRNGDASNPSQNSWASLPYQYNIKDRKQNKHTGKEYLKRKFSYLWYIGGSKTDVLRKSCLPIFYATIVMEQLIYIYIYIQTTYIYIILRTQIYI